MKTYRWRKTAQRSSESGQALVFLVLALSITFLGAAALSVDMSNLWFHRQAAQNAADAACTAGAMDLLVDAQGGATGHQGFVNGTAFNCTAGSAAIPCQYAAKNGYNSSGAGNLVSVTFPTTVTGVPTGTVPPAGLAPTAFINVVVSDDVQTYFSGLLTGNRTQTVRASAACGVVSVPTPIPILVLDPHNPVVTPAKKALDIQGTPTIKIVGGPSQSIQVNSDSTTAVNIGGSATINLSKGGNNFDGSSLGTYVGPTTAPSGFVTAGGGKWMVPSPPIADPFAQIAAPALPADPVSLSSPVCNSTTMQAGNCNVLHLDHGCPDTAGCTLFTHGYYPNGICIGNGGCGGGIAHASKNTAIFDPGIYYVNNGMQLMAKAMVRPGTGVGDGTGGTVFYLTGTVPSCSGQPGLICVGSNSGSEAIDAFNTSAVTCPGGPAPDARLNLPATLPGNVLLAPCTGTYGDPTGNYRGILFFQDRASGGGGGWGGGGGFLLAGSMYFHHCNATGTGVSCGANPTYYNSIFTLQGNSGSASWVLGNIITDNLAMGGTPTINMALNPNATYNTLKATLLR